jgi:hypothetical protein
MMSFDDETMMKSIHEAKLALLRDNLTDVDRYHIQNALISLGEKIDTENYNILVLSIEKSNRKLTSLTAFFLDNYLENTEIAKSIINKCSNRYEKYVINRFIDSIFP